MEDLGQIRKCWRAAPLMGFILMTITTQAVILLSEGRPDEKVVFQ